MPSSTITATQAKSWIARHFTYKEKKNGEICICNPFDGDTKFHLGINCDKLCLNDWRGNSWAGVNPQTGLRNRCTFIRFVQQYLARERGRCSYFEAVQDVTGSSLSAMAILAAGRFKQAEEVKEKASLGLSDGCRELDPSNVTELDWAVWRYLREDRGLSDEIIVKNRVMADMFNVVFPYYEYDELVYWQKRSILNKRFEFPDSSVGVTKGEFIYGYDMIEPASYIIITEAIFDSMTLDDQAAAIGGAAITAHQVKKVRALGPRDGVMLGIDNDVAGLESALNNCAMLSPYFKDIFYSIPPKIEYEKDGEKKVTKDWNDILVYTKESPRKLFEDNLKPLDMKGRIFLKGQIIKEKEAKTSLSGLREYNKRPY